VILAILFIASSAFTQQPVVLGKPLKIWTSQLFGADAKNRRNAAFALGRAGPAAVAAVPNLVNALHDPEATVREAAAFALGEIGVGAWEETFPALIKLLQSDKSHLVRRSAAFALGSLAKDGLPPGSELAPRVRQALDNALGDGVALVRQNAAWALGRLGPDQADSSSKTLIKALSDPDALVRRESASALGNLGAAAHPSATALVELAHADHDREVSLAALTSLATILTPQDKALAERLRGLLSHKDAEVSRLAAIALANIGGPEATSAVPILCGALTHRDADVRRQAAAALAHLGVDGVAGQAALIAALADRDPLVRRNAALALGKIGEKAGSAVPALTKLLANKEELHEIRLYAAEALAQMSPAIVPAIPTLVNALRDEPDYHLRQRAVLALGRLDDIERDGIPAALSASLSETDPSTRPVRYDSAVFLAIHLGSRTPAKALDVLSAYLEDKDLQLYVGASAQVGTAGREAQGDAGVKPILEGDSRFQAALALGRIGPGANRPDIVRGLQNLVKSPEARVREAAREALLAIQK
jgi:HEAT repeat protein